MEVLSAWKPPEILSSSQCRANCEELVVDQGPSLDRCHLGVVRCTWNEARGTFCFKISEGFLQGHSRRRICVTATDESLSCNAIKPDHNASWRQPRSLWSQGLGLLGDLREIDRRPACREVRHIG